MKIVLSSAALVALTAMAASAQTVYTNSGSSVASLSANAKNWSTPTTCTSATFCGSYIGANDFAAGYIGGGEGHPFANDDVLTLSLAGLGSHTGGTLFFTLFVIDSWDGDAYGCCGPDRFQVAINGSAAMDASFSDHMFPTSDFQSYPDPFAGFQTGTQLPGTGATENGTLGTWYWTSEKGHNSVYEIAIPFVDASALLNIDFDGQSDNQGFADESWGLRSIRVDLDGRTTATPEPASLTLFGTGVAGLGVAIRRRKQKAATA